MKKIIFIFLFLSLIPFGHAQDNIDQKNLYDFMMGIRCLECAGESIATSSSPIAQSLRNEIIARWQKGEDEKSIALFLQNTYGDKIFFRPAFKASTLFLWLSPFIFIILGLLLARNFFKKN